MLLGAYVVMPLLNETYQVIELRRKNPKLRKPDVLQNLLDAEYQEEDTAGSTGPVKNGNAAGGMWKSRSLTTDEVLVSAATLFVAGFVTRKAVTDFEYNGLKYKAGTCIMSPTLQIHRDARYWPQPLTFNPDRYDA
ncbi:hypothetical protein V5799_030330 [Amblyomma americanum]|uniref:Uncharacterized protein n=1 Tax=Amblyomma americanum TaxID=6943 RepID=A0AAQ4ENL3_AMBAM